MILDDIVEKRKKQLEREKQKHSFEKIRELAVNAENPCKDFYAALKGGNLSVISEVKKASPSKSVIKEDFHPVETAIAYEKAGADASILVVNNLSSSAINETIDKMVEEIESSQIIMLPGGFSGGDEPEGSGKFIATTFRNPKVKEAVTKLLNNRDGLMLGICNGFQALIKLGLVPYGEIKEIGEDDPTLTFNTIGRHISSMAYTRVASVKSPWFSSVNAGDVFAVPISHGEGRFVANDDVMKKLIENGQVATQYVNLEGTPVSDMPFNPNGSVCAVEGITSPDGRVLGKMGHVERKGNDPYANVPFEKDMKIFESGVNYFK